MLFLSCYYGNTKIYDYLCIYFLMSKPLLGVLKNKSINNLGVPNRYKLTDSTDARKYN